jgi:hypothetical protein
MQLAGAGQICDPWSSMVSPTHCFKSRRSHLKFEHLFRWPSNIPYQNGAARLLDTGVCLASGMITRPAS